MDRFVVKETQINSENQTSAANVDDGRGDDAVEVEARTGEFDEGQGDDPIIDDEDIDGNISDEGNDATIGDEGNDATSAIFIF